MKYLVKLIKKYDEKFELYDLESNHEEGAPNGTEAKNPLVQEANKYMEDNPAPVGKNTYRAYLASVIN